MVQAAAARARRTCSGGWSDGDTAARAAHAEPGADHPEGGGGADRRAGDHDAAPVPGFRDRLRRRQRVPVGAVPRAGGDARAARPSGCSSTIPDGRARGSGSPPPCAGRRCSTRSSATWPATATTCRPTRSAATSRQPVKPSPACSGCCSTCTATTAGPAQVAERLVDLDEGMQEWRYRHVKMVERTIGDKHRHRWVAGRRRTCDARCSTPRLPRPVGRRRSEL